MYFPFFSLRHGGKRPAAQPQTIDSEFPNILQIRARGSRGSGNTGLTIFSSFFFLRLHSFLRPLPFFGFLLAVDGSLALGLFPDAPELARLVRMLGERQPRLRHSRLPASEACLNGHAARNLPWPWRVPQFVRIFAEIIGKLLLRVLRVFHGETVLRFFQSARGHSADGRIINRISAWRRHNAPFSIYNEERLRQSKTIDRRSRFSAPKTDRLRPMSGAKRPLSVSVGLLTCVSSGGLSAFSEFSNDWLSPTAGRLDTYSAGSVGTRTPFSCSAGQSERPARPRKHELGCNFRETTQKWSSRVPPTGRTSP